MRIYLDHNATTPMRPEVRELYLDLLERAAANPSSLHAAGRAARQVLDEARERTAAALGVDEDEVVFTPGGTVSINVALLGALAAVGPERALVTSSIEHSAVLETARFLARGGRPLHLLLVDAEGRIELGPLPRLARGAALVSLQAANNEVGSLVDLKEVSSCLASLEERPLLHTDAVQALGRVPLCLAAVDLASFSAHKVGGPLGVGVLVRRRGTRLVPLTHGGGQEADLWPGTENVPAIGAAALAIELAVAEREAYARHTSALVRLLWNGLRVALPGATLHGPAVDRDARLPNTLNVSFPGVDGRILVTRLDLAGLAASAGSACASGSLEPSHVLRAMGLDDERARAGLRLSVGMQTSPADIHNAVDILRKTLV